MAETTTSLLTEPMHVFAALACVSVAVYSATGLKAFKPVFRFVPPVVWLYFTPLFLTFFGITPPDNPLYGWMSAYLLPVALLLITVSVDLPALAKIGTPAIVIFASGTVGVGVGAMLAMVLLNSILPADGWQSLSMLSAAWIGGAANMVAVHQSLQADPSLFGPIVIVDTLVGYGWLGVLIALSAYQGFFDRHLRADRRKLESVVARQEQLSALRRTTTVKDIIIIACGAFAVAIAARHVAAQLPPVGDPVIVSASTWAIIIVVTSGLAMSFTPLRKLENAGATDFGYAALFLLMASVGAQADFRAVLESPQLILAGLIVMATHIAFLLSAAYFMRAPSFFVATGSMANIGGAVSGPVAAAAYAPSLAPLGALLGVTGYIVGIYLPILISSILAAIASA